MERKNRVVATLTRGVESLLKRSGVEVIRGHARLVSKHSVQVGDDTYHGQEHPDRNGIAAGRPADPGNRFEGVLDSTGVLGLTELPSKVAIIGGGYVGLEFAGFFASAGAEVTVIEMLPQIAAGQRS